MPVITLTQTACTSGLGTERVTLYYDTADNPNRIIYTNAVAEELAGAGIEITQIRIIGRARNSASSIKQLRVGFKDSASAGKNAWSTYNGSAVLGPTFTCCGASNNGNYIYKTTTLTYSATSGASTFALFAGHIKERFAQGLPVYLGIINPRSGTSVQTYVSGYWKIEIAYELLGNIPSANVNTAVIGSTQITTTINKVVEGSSTTLRYKIGETVLATKNLGTGISDAYTPPTTAGQYFPTATTATMTVEAETFVDGVSYGTVSTSVALTLPEDKHPVCGCTPTRTWKSGTPEAARIAAYVQNQSGVTFTLSGTAKYGATITGYSLTIENTTYTGANPAHALLTGSGSIPFTYTVTDSRGLWRQYDGTLTVLAWQKPQIQNFRIARANATGDDEPIDGTYARSTVQASVSDLTVSGVEKNTLSYRVAYREIAAEGEPENAWTYADTITAATGEISVSGSARITSGGEPIGGGGVSGGTNLPFNDMAGYEFRLLVWDIYTQNSPSTAMDEMPTKEQLWDIDEATGKMGFGGDAPEADEDAVYRFHGLVDFAAGAKGLHRYVSGEQPTGDTWVNGKPIYRCVYFATGYLAKQAEHVLFSIPDIEMIVKINGFFSGNGYWKKPLNYYRADSNFATVQLSNTNSIVFYSQFDDSWEISMVLEYTKSTDTSTMYVLPILSANSGSECTASASSVYASGYPASNAFNGDAKTHWASGATDANRWIQIKMPNAIRNIRMSITNPQYTNAVVSGTIRGSNNGSSWTNLQSFSGRPSTAYATTRHVLGNAVAYSYVRIAISSWSTAGQWCGIGDIRIEGDIT